MYDRLINNIKSFANGWEVPVQIKVVNDTIHLACYEKDKNTCPGYYWRTHDF